MENHSAIFSSNQIKGYIILSIVFILIIISELTFNPKSRIAFSLFPVSACLVGIGGSYIFCKTKREVNTLIGLTFLVIFLMYFGQIASSLT